MLDAALGLLPDLGTGLFVVRLEFDRLSYWFAFHAFGVSRSSRDDTE